ncbi:MAG: 4Fe-4S binding protein [Syntrophobacteraceae bacterium]
MDQYAEVYEKLADHLDRLPEGYPRTPSGVEIRILRRLFTPEQAALAQLVTLAPEPPGAIASRGGLDPAETALKLEEMSRKGLIFRFRKGPEVRYMAAAFMVGIWEFHLNDLDVGLIKDVREFMPYLLNQSSQLKSPQLRTIPVTRAIAAEQVIMPYEEARRIVSGEDKIAVAPCICRREHKMTGAGCDRPLESCLVFGVGALYYQENGLGRPIDQQEAFEILDQAEKAGLVLQPSNTQKVSNICTCCGCCCQILRNLKGLPEPATDAASNYFATIDRERCIGCGTCMDRCQMEAIETDGEVSSILRKRCIGCGLCVTTCPEEAIRLQEKTEAQKSIPPSNRMERFKLVTQDRMAKREGGTKDL